MTSTSTQTVTTLSKATTVPPANLDSNHEENGLQALDSKKGKFRFQGKSLVITFPHCQTSPQVALQRFKESPKTSTCSIIVAQEKHADEDTHLHVFIEHPKKFNIRDASFFDFAAGKHGNMERVKFREAAIQYVTKDGNYVYDKIEPLAILQEWAKKKDKKRKRNEETKSSIIYNNLIGGKTYEDILMDKELGPFCVLHSQQIKSIANEISYIQEKKAKVRPPFVHLIINGTEYDMLSVMPFKAPQFWIHGPPNVGKSTLINKLEEAGLVSYEIPTNNDFANWSDDKYDFCFIDEFKGQLTIQFLNLFLQGSKMTLPGKYVAGGKIKNKNMPIFILSNYTPEEVYHKKSDRDLEPLLRRIRIIHLTSFLDYEVITQEPNRDLCLTELYCSE